MREGIAHSLQHFASGTLKLKMQSKSRRTGIALQFHDRQRIEISTEIERSSVIHFPFVDQLVEDDRLIGTAVQSWVCNGARIRLQQDVRKFHRSHDF